MQLDIRVDGVELDDVDDHYHFDWIDFSSRKQNQLREFGKADRTFQALQQIVHRGWSTTITDIPTDLRPYWPYRDEIGILDGVLFKGRQVLIPEQLRNDILDQLHEAHMEIEKTKRLARECVYWPNIHHYIERIVKTCQACQENQPEQKHETMIAREIPAVPWR